MKMGETPNTYNSVVSYQADANFATRVINIQTWPSRFNRAASSNQTEPLIPPALMPCWF
jgi:hypothetical protein